MIFCGQCGSQLAPGTTRCPYCGAVSHTPDEVSTQGAYNTLQNDAPTIESNVLHHNQIASSTNTPNSAFPHGPFTPPEQHKLVLRPDGIYDYDAQGHAGVEPTSTMRPAAYNTYPSATRPASNPGAQSSLYNSAATPGNYPGVTSLPAQHVPNYQSYQSIPDPVSGYGSFVTQQQYQAVPPLQSIPRKRSRLPLLLSILLLLIAVSAGAVFYTFHRQMVTNTGNGGTGTGTTTTAMTPTDHARAIVQQYYNDINNKNYYEAYYLWKRNATGQTYNSFVQGYAHTVHDDLTISNIIESGGTERVVMTIVATEDINGSSIRHTYSGYYLVQQVGDSWKIVRGYLVKVR